MVHKPLNNLPSTLSKPYPLALSYLSTLIYPALAGFLPLHFAIALASSQNAVSSRLSYGFLPLPFRSLTKHHVTNKVKTITHHPQAHPRTTSCRIPHLISSMPLVAIWHIIYFIYMCVNTLECVNIRM